MELRCPSGILFGIVNEDGLVEFRCRSSRCGHAKGTVVLHYLDPNSGVCVKTKKFTDAQELIKRQEERRNAADRNSAPVRSP